MARRTSVKKFTPDGGNSSVSKRPFDPFDTLEMRLSKVNNFTRMRLPEPAMVD